MSLPIDSAGPVRAAVVAFVSATSARLDEPTAMYHARLAARKEAGRLVTAEMDELLTMGALQRLKLAKHLNHGNLTAAMTQALAWDRDRCADLTQPRRRVLDLCPPPPRHRPAGIPE